ncbi:hypothetical protein [Vibrio sp. dhg]|uniref:hypothetical protein n=1 Tax=Vibrio sp. dhg TaxID=2163016 RepID=UPI000E546D66|nr:hypothetical protein [Vibrio sp. dhg]AXT74222.1 hypothetical protein DBX26_24950 [Vibrio sp. dhg]
MYDHTYLYLVGFVVIGIVTAFICFLVKQYKKANERLKRLSIEEQRELLRFANERSQKRNTIVNPKSGAVMDEDDLFDVTGETRF